MIQHTEQHYIMNRLLPMQYLTSNANIVVLKQQLTCHALVRSSRLEGRTICVCSVQKECFDVTHFL